MVHKKYITMAEFKAHLGQWESIGTQNLDHLLPAETHLMVAYVKHGTAYVNVYDLSILNLGISLLTRIYIKKEIIFNQIKYALNLTL